MKGIKISDSQLRFIKNLPDKVSLESDIGFPKKAPPEEIALSSQYRNIVKSDLKISRASLLQKKSTLELDEQSEEEYQDLPEDVDMTQLVVIQSASV
jgi:hypothetical protein